MYYEAIFKPSKKMKYPKDAKALAGKRKPNEAIKKKLDELGINPWENKKANKSLELTEEGRDIS